MKMKRMQGIEKILQSWSLAAKNYWVPWRQKHLQIFKASLPRQILTTKGKMVHLSAMEESGRWHLHQVFKADVMGTKTQWLYASPDPTQSDGHTTTVVLTKTHKTSHHNRENGNLGKLTSRMMSTHPVRSSEKRRVTAVTMRKNKSSRILQGPSEERLVTSQ